MKNFLNKIIFSKTATSKVTSNKKSLKKMLSLSCFTIAHLCWGISSAAAAAQFESSHQSGTVAFSGQHAGMDFEGKFERWQATLVLPPQKDPSIVATFYMTSAKTGDSIYDSTLPEFDWFDIENHRIGKFVSTEIVMTEGGYQVSGELTIKAIAKAVSFLLTDNQDNLTTSFGINRLDYKIGLESDPDAEWVDKTISISMTLDK